MSLTEPIKNVISMCSLNWWQADEVRIALKTGEKLVRIDQDKTPSYFLIEGPSSSSPFRFSVSNGNSCSCR